MSCTDHHALRTIHDLHHNNRARQRKVVAHDTTRRTVPVSVYRRFLHLQQQEPTPTTKPTPRSWRLLTTILLYYYTNLLLSYYTPQGGERENTSRRNLPSKSTVGCTPKVTFADIGGNEAAKEALMDVLNARRDMERYLKLGARQPCGEYCNNSSAQPLR